MTAVSSAGVSRPPHQRTMPPAPLHPDLIAEASEEASFEASISAVVSAAVGLDASIGRSEADEHPDACSFNNTMHVVSAPLIEGLWTSPMHCWSRGLHMREGSGDVGSPAPAGMLSSPRGRFGAASFVTIANHSRRTLSGTGTFLPAVLLEGELSTVGGAGDRENAITSKTSSRGNTPPPPGTAVAAVMRMRSRRNSEASSGTSSFAGPPRPPTAVPQRFCRAICVTPPPALTVISSGGGGGASGNASMAGVGRQGSGSTHVIMEINALLTSPLSTASGVASLLYRGWL